MRFCNMPVALVLNSFLVAFILSSCNSTKKLDENFLYFQTERDNIGIVNIKERVIQTNDILNIQVISKTLNQQEAALFNSPSAGISSNPSVSAGVSTTGYVVGINGSIEFPIIGTITASGLTKAQLQKVLVDKLSSYIKDPSVSVVFTQFAINVLGEVKSPGIKTFPIDKVTILDAISASGDLTDFGKRKDVTVIREENGRNLYIQMDLTSGSVFQSPAYQLHPNDIVYVGANNKKLESVNKNANAGTIFRTVGTALSLTFSILNFYFNRLK
ncbi:MAG: polysaccharide biosynthesis/export family protein [Ginsengibacter sp.]